MRFIAAGVATFVLIVTAVAASRVGFEPLPVAAAALPGVDAEAPWPASTPLADAAAPPISGTAAEAIAKIVAPSARLLRAPDLVEAQGRLAYEVTLDEGTIYVDASTGTVLANTVAGPIVSTKAGESDHDSRSKDSRHAEKEHDDDDDD